MSMPSKEDTKAIYAQFSDGRSARSRSCQVQLAAGGLAISRGDGSDELIWPYSSLSTHTAASRGASEVIVEWREMPGAQVHIRDAAFIERLVRIAPQLSTGGMRRRWLMPVMAVAGVIACAIALAWLFNMQPARAIANMLPDQMRVTLGRNVIAQLSSKSKACTAPDGLSALNALKERLLQGVPDAKHYDISVVALPISNAFAAPGGQMVISGNLIETAKSADEVAGVLAHEIGHGIERHPEAGLIRVMGLSFILELISGGSTGGVGSFGLLFLQTAYVRRDEAAADRQALRLLRQAKISQNGLGQFFSRLARKRCKRGDEKCKSGAKAKNGLNVTDLLRTHPYPEDRAEIIRKSRPYPTTPALTDAQWSALRKICSETKKPS